MRRSRTLAALGLALALAPAAPAAAHHGWEHYDTAAPSYASGTVTDVTWGNPHPEVTLRVERTDVPAEWADRELPAELEEIGGRDVLEATRAYSGGSERLTLFLAPIERLAAWGLEGRVEVGERLEVVGYLDRDHADELRPELIVRGDGQTVRQRSVPLPVPPEPTPAEGGGDAADTPGPATVAAEPDDSSAPTVWLLTGGGFLILLVAGAFHVVRRANRT
ncbi:DUF6152 family protein [Streptomyces griseomycini]|uniref:DUF6152 family protein n=1 Tax=Streptomyces griseomycini TaxID=66895 RepID=UPI0034146887